jgi:hypothetical protein
MIDICIRRPMHTVHVNKFHIPLVGKIGSAGLFPPLFIFFISFQQMAPSTKERTQISNPNILKKPTLSNPSFVFCLSDLQIPISQIPLQRTITLNLSFSTLHLSLKMYIFKTIKGFVCVFHQRVKLSLSESF